MTGSIRQQRSKTRAKRVTSRAKISFAQKAGWRPVDKKKEIFVLTPISKEGEFTISNIDGPGNSRFQTFERIISDAFLAKILAGSLPELWLLQCSRYLVPTLQMFYMMLAILVRIQGLYITLMLNKVVQDPCPQVL